MAVLVPPPKSPRLTRYDDDGLRRVHFHLHLVGLTTATILITGRFMTLGVFPAIVALVTAKHVLVAILAMGLGMGSKAGLPSRQA